MSLFLMFFHLTIVLLWKNFRTEISQNRSKLSIIKSTLSESIFIHLMSTEKHEPWLQDQCYILLNLNIQVIKNKYLKTM